MNEPVRWRWLLPLVPMALAAICAVIFLGTLCFLGYRAIVAMWSTSPEGAVFYGSLVGAIVFFAIGWASMALRDMR